MEKQYTHESGSDVTPDIEYVREKEPGLKKPENFFQYFFDRLEIIEPEKISALMKVFSQWILGEFMTSGKNLKDFAAKNKDHKDLYTKNLYSFIGYGLIAEISIDSYRLLDNIGVFDENPELDAQISLVSDKILANPDQFFAKLYKKIGKLREKAGYEAVSPRKERAHIFQESILSYRGHPTVFNKLGELPVGLAREAYKIDDEYEQIFKLGRLGISGPLITRWEEFRHNSNISAQLDARYRLRAKGADYWFYRKHGNAVVMLSYYDVEEGKYILRPAPIKYTNIPSLLSRYIKHYEQACINDFFKTLLNINVTEGEFPTITDVADVIKYFAESLMLGQPDHLNEVNRVNGAKRGFEDSDFSAKAILTEFGDMLPMDIKFLFSQDRKCYRLLSSRVVEGGSEYLLELSGNKLPEHGVRMLVTIGDTPRSFKCKLFRKTSSPDDDIYDRKRDLHNWGRYYMPESEFFLMYGEDGQIVQHGRDCTLGEDLYARIHKIVKSFLSEDGVSITQDVRGGIERVLVKFRSKLLTADNMPFYVATVAKFIFDIVAKAIGGGEIKTPKDLYEAIDRELANDSDVWNLIDTEDFQDRQAACERNQVFLTCPVSYPKPRNFNSSTPSDKLKANLYKVYKIIENDNPDNHTHSEKVLDYFLKGGNWSKVVMAEFFKLKPEEQEELLSFFKYINDTENDKEKLLRLQQTNFYAQLFFWGYGNPDLLKGLEGGDDEAKKDIGYFTEFFLEIINKLLCRTAGKRAIGILTAVDNMPKEMQDRIREFWKGQLDVLLRVVERACELPSEENWNTNEYLDPKYALAKVVLIINGIANKLGIKEIPKKYIKSLQKDWDKEFNLPHTSNNWFDRFAGDEADLHNSLAFPRSALYKEMTKHFKRKGFESQKSKLDFILELKDELEFLELWTTDYKSAHSNKAKFNSVVKKLSVKNNFPYLLDLLFSDPNRWNDEEYGDVLTDVYEELNDSDKIEFLEKLNLLQFFYDDSKSGLVEGPTVDVEIPVAVRKLHNHIKAGSKVRQITRMATPRIVQYSKLMHKKRMLGVHYAENSKSRNYEIELII